MIPDCPVVDIEIAIEGLGFDTAIDGTLVPRPLRAAAPSEALDELQTIVGIGPFSAELILVRGAGAPDVFPTHEKRLHAIMKGRYDDADTPAGLIEVSDRSAPYRSWIAFHLRSQPSSDSTARPKS